MIHETGNYKFVYDSSIVGIELFGFERYRKLPSIDIYPKRLCDGTIRIEHHNYNYYYKYK